MESLNRGAGYGLENRPEQVSDSVSVQTIWHGLEGSPTTLVSYLGPTAGTRENSPSHKALAHSALDL
jgi:hypothetical protein